MAECVGLVETALVALARGEAVLPLRSIVALPDGTGVLGVMPAWLGGPASFGLKIVSVFPGNHGSRFGSHQGVVVLFGLEHGEPLVVADAGAITAIRTAAASGVATRALARPEAGDLAILGSGVQAATHLDAMRVVRRVRRVRVWSRSPEAARAFAAAQSRRHGIPVLAMPDARGAVEGADLVCTTTSARTPVLEGAWLAPGAHVNAVGACFPATRELDSAAVARSRLFTDRRESLMAEAGDFLLARAEGAITDAHVAGELGDVLTGAVAGRTRDDEITLFKSLGIAVEDLAAAHHVWRRALDGGAGIAIDFDGLGPG